MTTELTMALDATEGLLPLMDEIRRIRQSVEYATQGIGSGSDQLAGDALRIARTLAGAERILRAAVVAFETLTQRT